MKIDKNLIVSFTLVIINVILIIKWDNAISWGLFYLIVMIFIILLLKQMDEWGIINKSSHKNYDETNEYFSNDGIFKFLADGFFVNKKEIHDFIKWTDINQIVSYNIVFYENSITFIEV